MLRPLTYAILLAALTPPAFGNDVRACEVIEVTYWKTETTPLHRVQAYARAYPASQITFEVVSRPGSGQPVETRFVRRRLGDAPLIINKQYPASTTPVLRGADRIQARCLKRESRSETPGDSIGAVHQ
jgi:hypothetical protein